MNESTSNSSGPLRRSLHEAAHLLPAQGPIAVFVHHNTLHAFQHLPFHEALAAASAVFDTEAYLPESRYLDEWRRGRITDRDLDAVLVRADPSRVDARPSLAPGRVERALMVHPVSEEAPATIRWRIEEADALRRLRSDLPPSLRATLVSRGARVASQWLDAHGRNELSLPALVARLAGAEGAAADATVASAFGVKPDAASLRRLLTRDPERFVTAALWGAAAVPGASASTADTILTRVGHDRSHRDLLLALTGEDSNALVDDVMIPLCGAFLDQGVSHWHAPERELGLYRVWRRAVLHGAGPFRAWLTGLRAEVAEAEERDLDAETVALDTLKTLGVKPENYTLYLSRVLLQLPGWAGMIHRLEEHPEERGGVSVSLMDYLAVRLTLKRYALRDIARRALGYDGPLHGIVDFARTAIRRQAPVSTALERRWRLFNVAQVIGLDLGELSELGPAEREEILARVVLFTERDRRRLWHEAYELHHRDEVLAGVAANLRRPLSEREVAAPRFQVVTCIDDREESLRRHFEELSPRHETFAVAGFFGLAIEYRGLDQGAAAPLCPVVARPTHAVEEEVVEDDVDVALARRRRRGVWARLFHHLGRTTRTMLGGLVLTSTVGALSLPGIVLRVLAPRLWSKVARSVRRGLLPEPRTRLKTRSATASASAFRVRDQADRVQTTLENLGLTRRFGRFVVVLGHGSSSVNNPHTSAYDCGACGGHDGGPNARLFANLANQPDVRALLRARGIDIPDATRFIGGLHDTATDAVSLFDTADVPPEAMGDFAALRAALDEARRRSAQERCRRLASAPRDPTPAEALRHVESRAVDLSEARPELGHVTNAVCVVGRRALTRGLFLDRRSFLVSYDPTIDVSGAILERILLAVGPVGAGINLEYYFSCVDNERFGAGTKLPHNLVGLLGVMDGARGDLRTGLPRQMIEIHEPVRLLLVVEATTDTLRRLDAKQPALRELLGNGWVRLASVDPVTGALAVLGDEGFVPVALSPDPVPEVRSSHEWYRGKTAFLGPAIVRARTEAAHVH